MKVDIPKEFSASREDLRHVVDGFWLVAKKYEIDQGNKKDDSTGVVFVQKAEPSIFYPPMQAPELLSSFAKLAARGNPSNEKVLDWVNRYGLLERSATAESQTRHEALKNDYMSLQKIKKEAVNVRAAVEYFDILSRRGFDELMSERLPYVEEKIRKGAIISELDCGLHTEWEGLDWVNLSSGEKSQYTTQINTFLLGGFESFLMDKLKDVNLALFSSIETSLDQPYRPSRTYHTKDLLSAIYLQLYMWITKDVQVRKCKNPSCQMLFLLTRKDKQFCSASCRSAGRKSKQ